MTTSWIRAVVVVGLVAWIAGCGGGSSEPAANQGTATIGAAGGTVLSEDGAQVVFPPKALSVDVTVRIAKDSTGAPPLPAAAFAAGAVYAVTPHGGDFAVHAEVVIPVDQTSFADNEQLLLVTAEPGDTTWRVLSGATYANGKLRALVMRFSFFQAIVVRDFVVPQIVTTIDNKNNIGADGAVLIPPSFVFDFKNSSYTQLGGYSYELVTRLRYPPFASVVSQRVGRLPPLPCAPTSYAHDGAQWRILRNGTEVATTVNHLQYMPLTFMYPRFESEFTDYGSALFNSWYGLQPGFGALHFYGEDNPRIAGYGTPSGRPSDGWAIPPANDPIGNDVLTWRGTAKLTPQAHNGRLGIEVSVPTSCGLTVTAVPLVFQVDLVLQNPYTTYYGVDVDPAAAVASIRSGDSMAYDPRFPVSGAALEFTGIADDGITWEFSTDPVNWQARPLPANVQIRDFADGFTRRWMLYIQNADPAQTGYYRAHACRKGQIYSDLSYPAACANGYPGHLTVVSELPRFTSQPLGQVVAVGETASFTAGNVGAPVPSLQWQQRSIGAAAFGFTAWTNIDGATGATYTTPALTLANTATQYRVWASNALGSIASDSAMLTVVEQLAPPVIQSQPGNLNVTVGGAAVFAATVSGTTPLSYQWRRNGTNITGANSAILTLTNVSAPNDGRYDLVVTNRAGSVTSEPAVLVVTLGTPVALPPTIAAPPASIIVAEGNAANFAVAVTGTGPYTYLWMKNGVQAPIPNGDLPSFGIASVTAADEGTYTVRVTNNVGTVVSAAATLTVGPGSGTPLAPAFTTAPAGLAVLPGGGATFAVAVSGTAPFTYQWRRNGADIVGATGAVLHIAAVNALDAGQYAVEVRNAVGVASSGGVPLIVIGAPVIVQQPSAANAIEGNTVTMSVAASGDGLLYQWTRNQVAIAGATSASYATPALTMADDGAVYGVIVYNGAGLVFSKGAVLTVSPLVAPNFSTQPTDQGVVEPAVATFNAVVGGSPAPTLQWQISIDGGSNWVDIAGATSGSYTTAATVAADSGKQYRLVATNSVGPVASAAVTLTVTAATPPLSVPLSAGKIAVGPFHTCAVKADATAACWGHGSSGQVLPGSTSDFWSPTVIPGLSGVTYVAAGQLESCAIDGTGTLWCWGGGRAMAAIQDGSGVNYTGVKAVAAGFLHRCFIDAGTTVRCWGDNSLGQLGADPALTGSGFVATPVFVNRLNSVPLTGVVALSADGDGNNTCALTSTGEVVCWGNGNYVALPVVTGVTVMRSGSGHACVVMAAGGMKCWGANGNAQLGNRSTTASPVPVNVIDLPGLLGGVTAIATQSTNTCVIPATGRVVCWGAVDPDRLNGTNTFGPTEKGNLAQRVAALSSGRAQTCALVVDGSIECWGSNQFGQLGLGHLNAINSGGPFPPSTSVIGGAIFWH